MKLAYMADFNFAAVSAGAETPVTPHALVHALPAKHLDVARYHQSYQQRNR